MYDEVTSPCIDAGDPNADWTAELWPHGKRLNMGAYGGIPQASMSLLNVGIKADFNNDTFVNAEDLALLVKMWLSNQILLSEDINRDGLVNLADFELFARYWLASDVAPETHIISPEDGAIIWLSADPHRN